jgi:hypothetical protein
MSPRTVKNGSTRPAGPGQRALDTEARCPRLRGSGQHEPACGRAGSSWRLEPRVVLVLVLLLPLPAGALQIKPLSAGAAGAQLLAQTLVGEGVEISNAAFRGMPAAAGTFSGGRDAVGFAGGIVLGTGEVAALARENRATNASHGFGIGGDPAIAAIAGNQSYDAASLELDLIPSEDALVFRYVFGSEEYNEFVNQPFNDAFGFFVNGENCAVNAGRPVSVNSINQTRHPELFRNNDAQNGSAPFPIELDGLTVVLTCVAKVRPGEVNRIKLVIADVQDVIVDSAVFVETGSMRSRPMTEVAHLRGDPAGAVTPGGKPQADPAPPPPPAPAGIVIHADPTLTLKPTGAGTGTTYAGDLDLTGIDATGTTGIALTSDLARFGHRLQLKLGGVWRSVTAERLHIPLAADGEKAFAMRLHSSGCAKAIGADEAFGLTLAGAGPDGQPVSRTLAVSVQVAEHGWLECLWPYAAALAGLSLLGFSLYGWWSPARFPRSMTVVLSPEPNLEEGAQVSIRSVRGSGSGFYRDARVFVCADFNVRGHAGGEAIARLRAENGRVRIKPALPGTLKRRDADGDWEGLADEEHAMHPGGLYCNEQETFFFSVRYQSAP